MVRRLVLAEPPPQLGVEADPLLTTATRNPVGISHPLPAWDRPIFLAMGTTRLLTLRETADALGWSEAKVRHLHKRGYLPTVRVGRRVYLRERDLAHLGEPSLGSLSSAVASRAEAPRVLRFAPRRRRAGG
jgi:hypothetical protein